MDIKYNITKLKGSIKEEVQDHVSVEEPLEMSLKFKKGDKWNIENISITMRTPGNDEDLVSGFLYNERIIENINEIEKVEKKGETVGDYNLQNKIEATINNTKNLDIGKIKKNFITNSSCGVCGKTSLDSIEVLKTNKIDLSFPKINYNIILKSPELLQNNQSEFSKTGGIHASALIGGKGEVIAIREDVGRHNALDKLIGHALKNKIIKPENQFIACSGRLNFELVQKALMSNIGLMAGVGAPTSLAIDLAKRFNMTLVGFVKQDSFNIYSNKERIIIKS
ncbi:MAG: formate dehydrogenase accessory sulfurtransferase FdhD [Pelagibacterales bacterium]|nr:formate dehydrogenase accessory sulfurtransferase FdhD [Pelagibacterales bacterium]